MLANDLDRLDEFVAGAITADFPGPGRIVEVDNSQTAMVVGQIGVAALHLHAKGRAVGSVIASDLLRMGGILQGKGGEIGSGVALSAGGPRARAAGLAFAAMLGQVSQQRVHVRDIGAVNQIAAPRFAVDQPGMRQLFQMKRQRTGRYAELLGHDARCQSVRASDDQRPKSAQALGLRQRGERFDGSAFIERGKGIAGGCCFHSSNIIEILN